MIYWKETDENEVIIGKGCMDTGMLSPEQTEITKEEYESIAFE